MLKRTTVLAALAAVSLIAAQPAFAADNPMVGGAPMYANKNIVQNAMNSKDHTTLVAAVKAAGLVDTLQGPGPFTVFAPTNAAFAKLPAGTVESLLKPENKAKLTKILTCHVVGRQGDVAGHRQDDQRRQGRASGQDAGRLHADRQDDAGRDDHAGTDENGHVATVTVADVQQSNGVIHVIDTVVLLKM